ncbi:MAG: hypothetical protein LQ338_006691 [Usnochroma carphineum]|nr:MAG: hypothetical protein LQ338_006691 [Usnochroma carphineum]
MDKESFFKEIYDLDEPDSFDRDVDGLLTILQANRPSQRQFHSSQSSNRRRLIHISRQIRPFGRTVSAPLAKTDLPKASLTEPLHEVKDSRSSIPADKVSRVQPSTDVDKLVTKMPTAKNRKRKRGQSLETLPEAQQIFRGLRFYFLPNDDINPARKLRIRKALERGAAWIKHWDNGITHVIVDRTLSYSDLLKYLKLSSIPSSITLVNELYPAECIQYQTLVNPDQRLYQVQGFQDKPAPKQPQNFESSPQSLPLKPQKRANNHPSQTPSRTVPSEESSVDRPPVAGTTRLIPETPVRPAPKLPNRPPDALDKAIEETLAVKDLPLDDDDDDETNPRSMMITNSADANDSEEEAESFKTKKAAAPQKSWQAKFSCMDKHTSTDKQSNPNARTIEILQQMTDYYSRTQDHWRSLAYRKAISALKKQPRRITTAEEAVSIPNIGSRLATKIEEIAFTDRLRRLENTSLDHRDMALQLFLKIYGVGVSQASQWIDQGHRTLADLLSKASLTKNQRIGIDHIEDFAARIPRKEVERHGKVVRDAMAQVDPTIELTIGGSYRRGAVDSGDVDFIITKPNAPIETLRTLVFDSVIPRLFAQNYLKTSLASSTSSQNGSKWHGCACLAGPSQRWRRIDFLFVPYEELGAALIYFTGNDIFNRSIRLLASKKGYRLNQRGLWRDVMRGRGRERITQGTLVEARNERRIFDILEVPWRPPNHRIC